MKRRLSWVLPVLFFLAGTAALLWDFSAQLAASLRLSEKQSLEIPPGAGLQVVTARMDAGNLFVSGRVPLYLRIYAGVAGTSAEIKAGEYELAPGMSALDALQLFVSGRTLLRSLRIVEGTTFSELLEQLRRSEFLKQTLVDASADQIMRAIGREGQPPEGRFFPDTYHFPKQTTDAAFLQRAATAMDAVLDKEWQGRHADLPYADPGEALVMASIVEKETGLAAERSEIAGVFVNRLRLGMRLQTDPTVIYGLGQGFDGNIRRVDLLTDTPYNTYTRAGLPPTPICMPGRDAIRAAMNPADTRALFFVARGDGSHAFSETLDQHEAAVRKYQLRTSHDRKKAHKK